MRRLALICGSALVLMTGCTAGTPHARAATPRARIVIIFMDNHGLSYIVSHPSLTPYEYSLWEFTASTPSEEMTSYYPLAHPSLPNYLAVSSGSTYTTTDSVTPGQFPGPTVWDQLTGAGLRWGVYEEGMPSACSSAQIYDGTASDGQYVLRHNPATPFNTVYSSTTECAHVQALSSLNTHALPAVSFITPNICDDMHGIPAGTTDPFTNCVAGSDALSARSDAWLTWSRGWWQVGQMCSSPMTSAAPPSPPGGCTRSRLGLT
jgi:hypothetical protein